MHSSTAICAHACSRLLQLTCPSQKIKKLINQCIKNKLTHRPAASTSLLLSSGVLHDAVRPTEERHVPVPLHSPLLLHA